MKIFICFVVILFAVSTAGAIEVPVFDAVGMEMEERMREVSSLTSDPKVSFQDAFIYYAGLFMGALGCFLILKVPAWHQRRRFHLNMWRTGKFLRPFARPQIRRRSQSVKVDGAGRSPILPLQV